VALGKAEFTFTDITGEKPQNFAQSFTPSIQVIDDRNVVAKNFDEKVQSKVVSVEAAKKMEEAYRRLELGDRDGAYEVAQRTWSELESLGYVQNEKQVLRYRSLMNDLAVPMAPTQQKDVLKKQKAADRNAQQSSAQ
jgi:hypothetical protein